MEHHWGNLLQIFQQSLRYGDIDAEDEIRIGLTDRLQAGLGAETDVGDILID